MKLDGAWITSAPVQAVCYALSSAGFEVFFVGGCVRNALLGVPQSDIDITTNALPEQTLECARSAGLKAIPTGIDHGTITVVCEGQPFEVTTFRADIDTDGRHATVRFSQDMIEDARRRDFTMNALYAAPDGHVVDPLGGLADLQVGRVRFIGQADQRIREDYLRSLRFFRFFAWYGNQDAGIDADGMAAVAAHLEGLQGLSRERVGAEILKLLSAPDPVQAVAAMQMSGVLNAVVVGADARALGPFVHFCADLDLPIDPVARLVALGGDVADLRLSKAQNRLYQGLLDDIGSMKSPARMGYEHDAVYALAVVALRAALLDMPLPLDARTESNKGETAQFPITASDLMPEFEGKALGQRLRSLEEAWIASGFTLTRSDLLE